jgi:hypothetical protein
MAYGQGMADTATDRKAATMSTRSVTYPPPLDVDAIVAPALEAYTRALEAHRKLYGLPAGRDRCTCGWVPSRPTMTAASRSRAVGLHVAAAERRASKAFDKAADELLAEARLRRSEAVAVAVDGPCVAGHRTGGKPVIEPLAGNRDKPADERLYVVRHGSNYLTRDGDVVAQGDIDRMTSWAMAEAAVARHEAKLAGVDEPDTLNYFDTLLTAGNVTVRRYWNANPTRDAFAYLIDQRCAACNTQLTDDGRGPLYDTATDDGTSHVCPTTAPTNLEEL